MTEKKPIVSPPTKQLKNYRSMESICDIVIDEDDVYEALCCIDPSKSCGPDEIVGRLLKEGTPCRSTPLTKLFNLSLKTCVLPSDWTSANITPVHKKGSRHHPRNYRPISLTSISVKILERLKFTGRS